MPTDLGTILYSGPFSDSCPPCRLSILGEVVISYPYVCSFPTSLLDFYLPF